MDNDNIALRIFSQFIKNTLDIIINPKDHQDVARAYARATMLVI